VEQALQHLGTPFVADAQVPTAEQPGKRALDDPAVPPEPLAGLDPAACKTRRDAASPQGTA
jgi:hypothetical protein